MTNNFLRDLCFVLLIASIVMAWYLVVEGLKANAVREVQIRKTELEKQYGVYEILAGQYCKEKCAVLSICYEECLKGNLIDAE